MNPANALSQLSPGMAECHARLMAVAKHGTPEAFSATLAGVLQRAELSISNAYDAGAKSSKDAAAVPSGATSEIAKAFREYLAVHPSIKLGGHEMDAVARELALIAVPAVVWADALRDAENLRAGYAAARLEIESLNAQLHAAKQINAAQFGLLAASIPGSALRASHGQAPAGATLRSMIEGMSVSVDVSTGDHDAGHRYFGTVTEVMECQGDKHGVTLLVQDAEPNFAAPTPQAAQPAPATQQAGEVRRAELVPGVMHCAKCKFQLNRVTLCVSDGNAYAGNNKTEPCPNGCGPLWPVTWEQEAKNCWKALEEMHERLMAAAAPQPSPTAQADSVQEDAAREPLQIFDSPRAKALMRAFEEGWAACRDAEFVGEDAQNDAFNQSATVNVCLAEDWTAAAERAARAPADSVQEDAACWHWLAEYLVGPRTDLDDEIVASETVNDLRKLVEAARKQGGA